MWSWCCHQEWLIGRYSFYSLSNGHVTGVKLYIIILWMVTNTKLRIRSHKYTLGQIGRSWSLWNFTVTYLLVISQCRIFQHNIWYWVGPLHFAVKLSRMGHVAICWRCNYSTHILGNMINERGYMVMSRDRNSFSPITRQGSI